MSIELSPDFQKEVERHENKETQEYDESRRETDFTVAKNRLLDDLRKNQEAKDRAETMLERADDPDANFIPQKAFIGDLKDFLGVDLKKQGEQERAEKKKLYRKQLEDADLGLEAAALANGILESTYKSQPKGDPLVLAKSALEERRAAVVERLRRAQDAGSMENAEIAAGELRTITEAEKKLGAAADHLKLTTKLSEDQSKDEAVMARMAGRIDKGKSSFESASAGAEEKLRGAWDRTKELLDTYNRQSDENILNEEPTNRAEAVSTILARVSGIFARSANEKDPKRRLESVRKEIKEFGKRWKAQEDVRSLFEEIESLL